MVPKAHPDSGCSVLIIGSGPDAMRARSLSLSNFDYIVTINNAWQITPAWTHLVYPYDFPSARMPPAKTADQHLIDETAFVPAQNNYGGFVYAGGTMAYTTAYWCLDRLRPRLIAHIGCDMHYPETGATHFYGTGTPDPLREDISLTSLEACSARFYCLAHQDKCQVWNLSQSPSRLLYPRITIDRLFHSTPAQPQPDFTALTACLAIEDRLNYRVEDGRYWQHSEKFNRDELVKLDQKWLAASNLTTPQ